MATRIVILSRPTDAHAFAVAEALRRKGAEAVLWHTTDFPSRSRESVRFDGRRAEVRVRGLEGDLSDADVVWNRRPGSVADFQELDPADRDFAELQCREFRDGLLSVLAPRAFWVNPWAATLQAERKVVQHALAPECGLEVPPTLFSNDPDEIRAFLRAQGGAAVYKTFGSGAGWRGDGGTWMTYTSLVSEEKLVGDRLLQLTPGIYQGLVAKSHELRITIMGERAFAARLHSQETEHGRLDWRRAHGELRVEACEADPALVAACLALMRRLGIVFACFDFIVTPAGRPVFLEANSMGQFLWVEQRTGAPLLDAFCEMLIQGRADFDWHPARVGVRLSEVDISAAGREAQERHVVPSVEFPRETAAV